MSYTDFSGLLILSMGCNIVYIVKGTGSNFFLFLDRIDSVKEDFIKDFKYLKIRYQNIHNFVKGLKCIPIDKFQQYYGKDTSKKVDEILNFNVNNETLAKVNEKLDRSINYCSGLSKYKSCKNLQSIAFITFIYAFYVSIFAPYENRVFNESLLLMNVYIFSISIIRLVYDICGKELPLTLKGIAIILLPLIINAILFKFCADIIFYEEKIFFKSGNGISIFVNKYKYILTVLTCFMGFLCYIGSVIFGSGLAILRRYRIYNLKEIKNIKNIEKMQDEGAVYAIDSTNAMVDG